MSQLPLSIHKAYAACTPRPFQEISCNYLQVVGLDSGVFRNWQRDHWSVTRSRESRAEGIIAGSYTGLPPLNPSYSLIPPLSLHHTGVNLPEKYRGPVHGHRALKARGPIEASKVPRSGPGHSLLAGGGTATHLHKIFDFSIEMLAAFCWILHGDVL